MHESQTLLAMVSLVAFVIAAFSSFLVVRSISRPLRAMTGAMVRLAAGDATIDVGGTARRDEIGDMARALDVFRANADKIVAMMKAEGVTQEIGALIAKAAAGDLTARVALEDKQGFLRDIGEQVNKLLISSDETLHEIVERTRSQALAVGEATAAVGQVSEGARTQIASLSTVAAALSESASSIREIAEATRGASAKAKAASDLVKSGGKSMERLAEVMESIAQNSRKISQITQVIAQIANRTHILSLNAAIEAARAGEHGKGFVVVAQEVGKLAESAAQNARQISEIVEQATADGAEGKRSTDAVREAMGGIETAAAETTGMIHGAAAAIDQQQASLAQLDSSVGELRGIAASNGAAAEEITATMVSLSKSASEMKARLGRFQTT